ncbi:MAG: 1-deoxy-D-xylulose-5-phosphate reductoisomerase [Phycisphaerae bacterium]
MRRRVIILGSTGSIGTQTLDVIRAANARHDAASDSARQSLPFFEVVGLAAGNNTALLAAQAREWNVRTLACAGEPPAAHALPTGTRVYTGPDAASQLVHHVPCDTVVAAIVGSAGLAATLEAVEQGRTIALANKETLVAAGELVVQRAHARGSALLPVDSEHAALFQLLRTQGVPPTSPTDPVHTQLARVILTASGGPFRTWSRDQIEQATPAQAIKHPTWSMGAKVTIDSAGLMNKSLELIEAHWLFGIPADKLQAIVHPQSIVHAIAEWTDASATVQFAKPDMRLPIHRALHYRDAFAHTSEASCERVDWRTLARLDFEPPDESRFPAITFAHRVMHAQGTAGAIMNAANEEAVAAFMQGGLAFGAIARLVAAAMSDIAPTPVTSLADVHHAESLAREHVRRTLSR